MSHFKNGPLVSVMIPTYNQPQYIAQAVESALAQDYPALEIIVSDDSNNKDTQHILQPYFSDPRFGYYKNETQLGRVGNYRKLLHELAKGDWVVMLDGDDYYIDGSYVSEAVKIIQNNPGLVLVGAGNKVFYEATGEMVIGELVDSDMVFNGKNVIEKRLHLPHHQTDIYLRSLACQLDFYRDPSMGSDSESLYRICLHGDVAYLNRIVAVWRIHDRNTTFTLDIDKQIKEMTFIDSVYKSAIEYIDDNVAKHWRITKYKEMTYQLLDIAFKSGNKIAVLKVLLHFGKFIGLKTTLSYFKKLVLV